MFVNQIEDKGKKAWKTEHNSSTIYFSGNKNTY